MSNQMKRYKILLLINVRWWNATAYYAVNIARLLKEQGHTVFIGSNPNYPAFEKAKGYGIEVIPLSFYGFHPYRLGMSFFRLIHAIKKHKIDIINSHRSEDHTFALLAKKFTGVKLAITRGDQRLISKGSSSSKRYGAANTFIATCESIITKNKGAIPLPSDHIHVIHGSVHEKRFAPNKLNADTAKRYQIDINKSLIGLIGRLSPVKDPFTFLKAAQRVIQKKKEVQFIIAGKEVEIRFSDIKAKITELGLEPYVILLPIIDDIADVMDLCDFGVITSIDSETISRVLLEWMYLRKPVIGTNVNAIGEIIVPGDNGEIFPPGDHEVLAQKIIKLIGHPAIRARYGENSREIYDQNYSERVFYKKTIAAFDGCFESTR